MPKQSTCHTCVYAHWDRGLWMRTLWSGFPAGPTCGNQPDSYGRMKECPCGRVCRNYRARPPVPTGDAVKTIPLGEGVYAYVDAADYEWLNQWHWRMCSGYAGRHENRRGKHKLVLMHREIMKPPKGKVVDHISGNKLDNTRANVRNVTRCQNVHNRAKQVGSVSLYKGVTYDKRSHQWRACIYLGRKYVYLGRFDSEVEAARAYDYKAVQVFGEFTRLNFPEEWPAEKRQEVHARWLRQQARQKGKACLRKRKHGTQRKSATRNAKRVTKRSSRRSPSRAAR